MYGCISAFKPGDIAEHSRQNSGERWPRPCVPQMASGDPSPEYSASLCVQDGDQYMVVWDKELLPTMVSEPMDYTAAKPQEVGLHIGSITTLLRLNDCSRPAFGCITPHQA